MAIGSGVCLFSGNLRPLLRLNKHISLCFMDKILQNLWNVFAASFMGFSACHFKWKEGSGMHFSKLPKTFRAQNAMLCYVTNRDSIFDHFESYALYS